MKVKTEQLKEMVSKAIQGASNNKLIPITQLMGIKKEGKDIMLTTTDATNYLYISGTAEDKDDIQVTVYAEQFAKLVSKMTCKEMYLKIENGTLEVKGNGTYTLELPLDENGELIKYPDPYAEAFKSEPKWTGSISQEDVKVVLDVVKPSLATSTEVPSITNYYAGDVVCASDRFKIASFDLRLFDKDCLVSPQLMELIDVIADGTINYFIKDNTIILNAKYGKIFCKHVDGVEEFPIQAIQDFIQRDFESVCTVNKNDFIALLERISLFVSKYDDKAVRLYFEADGIRVSNKSRKSNELIEYLSSKDYKAYDCIIDVDMLVTQLKAYNSDSVEIHYNNETSLKFVDNDIVQITALIANN